MKSINTPSVPVEKKEFDDVLKRMFSMPPAPKKAPPKPAQQPKK